jgi:hypothetical protein
MGAATIGTLVGVFLAVGAIALYLIIISYTLNRVSFNLGTVLIGVRAIVNQTAPVGEVVGQIADDVEAIDNAVKDLLAQGRQVSGGRRARALRAGAGTYSATGR